MTTSLHSTIQVLRHRAATRVVPFIPNWMYAGVYYPLWPNSSNTAHVGCATRLEFWSGTIHLIHRMYNQYLFLSLRLIPHVCRRHTVLQSLCNRPIWNSCISASTVMHRQPRQILCFFTTSTQTGENLVHLVRFTRQLDQNITALSISSSLSVCYRVWRCRPGPRCLPGQRAVHEAPRQQDRQCLLYHIRRLRQIRHYVSRGVWNNWWHHSSYPAWTTVTPSSPASLRRH